MRSVTGAIIRVRIRHRCVVTSIVVANKIVTVRYQVPFTKATSKSRVEVVDASVDDADLDAGAGVASSAELVDLGLHVGGEGVHLSAVVLPLAERTCGFFRSDAGPCGDLLLDRNVDAADWPQRLDRRQGHDFVHSLGLIN